MLLEPPLKAWDGQVLVRWQLMTTAIHSSLVLAATEEPSQSSSSPVFSLHCLWWGASILWVLSLLFIVWCQGSLSFLLTVHGAVPRFSEFSPYCSWCGARVLLVTSTLFMSRCQCSCISQHPEWLHSQCSGILFQRSCDHILLTTLLICNMHLYVEVAVWRDCPVVSGGNDQSIGSTIPDSIVHGGLWLAATGSCPFGYFSRISACTYVVEYILHWGLLAIEHYPYIITVHGAVPVFFVFFPHCSWCGASVLCVLSTLFMVWCQCSLCFPNTARGVMLVFFVFSTHCS